MKVLKEFKEFAVRGNVIDLAVGIIIGGAFGKIVSSIVGDLVMPPFGLLIGKEDFKDKKLVLQDLVKDGTAADAKVLVPEVAISYGAFIQHVIEFTIVAFAVFLLVKGINALKKKEATAPAPPPAPSPTEKLLGEIRDLLAKPQRP
jgi:large conductance mechanosensitive channel